MSSSRPLTLEQSAQRIGSYVWVEARLFEILGGWVQQVPEPEVKVFLAEQSHRHALYAQMWRDRLPHLREMDVDSLVRPADREIEQALALLSEAEVTMNSADRLVTVFRVILPKLIETYSNHRELCCDAADRPVMNTLDMLLANGTDDLNSGETRIRSLLAMPSNADADPVS